MILNDYTSVAAVFDAFGVAEGIELLYTELGIECKPFTNGDVNYYICNYDQIKSPKAHPLVIQCRSLIVDEIGNVVSKKYDRFFNIGECPDIVGKINIQNSTIMDKEDGSLIGIWFNPIGEKWEISTRSMARAEGPFELPSGETVSFADMVISTMLGIEPLQVNDDARIQFQEKMNSLEIGKNITLIFEWVHPLNRIVTPYTEPAMVFITATAVKYSVAVESSIQRCNVIFDELKKYFKNVRRIGYFNSNGKSIEEIENIVADLKDLKEGFVIQCNETGIRAKIKSKTYVTAHRLRGEFAVPRDKDLCALVKQNETDEFLSYFPEWTERIEGIKDVTKKYIDSIEYAFSILNALDYDQKKFACIVQEMANVKNFFGSIAASIMFNLRKGATMQDCINRMTENRFYDFYTEAKKHHKT